jgi:hypothetical protein
MAGARLPLVQANLLPSGTMLPSETMLLEESALLPQTIQEPDRIARVGQEMLCEGFVLRLRRPPARLCLRWQGASPRLRL